MVVYPVPVRSITLNIKMDYERAEYDTNERKEDAREKKGG